MVDRTYLAAGRQLEAMGADRYDVAIGRPDGLAWRIVLEAAPPERILEELSRLKRRNAEGWGVHVRPCEPHGLVFVDDVDLGTWERMIEQGYEPACILETSPRPPSHQLWMRHGRELEPADRRHLARWFARRARADVSGAGRSHWGRLAGFTNRKRKHRGSTGMYPYVLVVRASGNVYGEAAHVLEDVLPRLPSSGSSLTPGRRLERSDLRSVSEFHADPTYGGDLHRAEMAWANHAALCGLSETEIVESILRARDLSKKGPPRRQEDYARRTAQKALAWAKGDPRP